MSRIEFVYFGITLFFSLVLLIKWKRRRGEIARRVNRGLRGYVSAKPRPVPRSAVEDQADADLIVA